MASWIGVCLKIAEEDSMRKKEWKLLITFHSTTDAMSMESVCKEQGIAGRMIPVPESVSAGCGLAWCAEPESRDILKAVMEQEGIKEQDMRERLI